MNTRQPILFFIFLIACISAMGKTVRSVNAADFTQYAGLSTEELFQLAENSYHSGDFKKSEPLFMLICSRYDADSDKKNRHTYAQSFIRRGNICYRNAAYSTAMDFYLQAQKIIERDGFDDLIGVVYGHIGNIYASCNDFESAVSFYLRALPYAYRFQNSNLNTMLLNNLVGVNVFLNKPDSASHYFHLFRQLNLDNPQFTHDLLLNHALLSACMHQYDSAEIYARKALRHATEQNFPLTHIGSVNSCLAQLFEDAGELDSAVFYLHINEKLAREAAFSELLIPTLKDLARVYDKLNIREKALEYKSEYLSISDSIFGQKEFNELKNKQVFHELQHSVHTISNLNAVRIKQRNLLVGSCVAILVFIGLVIGLYFQKRKLQEAWNELYERNRRQLHDEINYRHRLQALEKALEEAHEKMAAINAATENEEGTTERDTGENAECTVTNGRKLVMQQAQRDKIAKDIRHVMENTEAYCSCEYSIERLAASIGSNARYVSEVLNDVFGKSFRTILNEYRIKKAMIRLSDTEHYGHLTIKAIAESVGYKSHTTFISAFTKFTGLKPGLYQKLADRHASTPDTSAEK